MAPRVLRALCGVLLGASATTQPGCDDASVVSCGEGVFHQIDGHAYCVYGTEATTPGSDFVCPARTPNKLEVAGGVVCTDDRSADGSEDIPRSACSGTDIAPACGVPSERDAGPALDAAPEPDGGPDATDAEPDAPDARDAEPDAPDARPTALPACEDPGPLPASVCEAGMSCDVVDLAAGGLHTCALFRSGSVVCWGDNHYGQLGDGTRCDGGSPVPRPVVGLTNVDALSAGVHHTCALLADETVRCWGDGGSGQAGAASLGTEAPTPQLIGGLTRIAQLSSGSNHTCALGIDARTVSCWGGGPLGELGRPTPAGATGTPGAVLGLPGAPAEIASLGSGSAHTCAVTSTGAVYCWGSNERGQLGLGTADAEPHPGAVAVSMPSGVLEIDGGAFHTCARLAAGATWCWGAADLGQVAVDPATLSVPRDVLVPRMVEGLIAHDGYPALAISGDLGCARGDDGLLYCWGTNFNGELGRGTASVAPTHTASPVIDTADSAPLRNASRLAVGRTHVCALLAGRVLCWGANATGQLGVPLASSSSRIPLEVRGMPSP
ncbi:MAG: hypothetical protein IT379_06570 [Deltaproteobacteria bacterium]|nr:hypothetical protein [Deltaproteobacteria bacterium]